MACRDAHVAAKPVKVSMRMDMQRMMEQEREKAGGSSVPSTGPEEQVFDSAPLLHQQSILFTCPLVGPEALPRDQMDARIEAFLREQLEEEPEMTAALMLHTLNRAPEAVAAAVDILCRFIDNIIGAPADEKFRRVRRENRAVKEKLLALAGAEEMLLAAGFQPSEDGEVYEMAAETAADTDRLAAVKAVLLAAEPVRAELYHDVRVFHPSAQAARIAVPDAFYSASADEIRRELEVRREAVEQMGMLRTREMRERDRVKELRRYRYALVRVRLPDDLLWQATFRAHAPFAVVVETLRESLAFPWLPFHLMTQTGQRLDGEAGSVAELGLAPAALLSLGYDAEMIADFRAQHGPITSYLQPELMQRVQSL